MSKVKDDAQANVPYAVDASDKKLTEDAERISLEHTNVTNNTLGYDKRRQGILIKALGDAACDLSGRKENEPEVLRTLLTAVEEGNVEPANVEASRIELVNQGLSPTFVDELGIVARGYLLKCLRDTKNVPLRLPSYITSLGTDPEAYKRQLQADSVVVDYAMPNIQRNMLTNELVFQGNSGERVTLEGSDLNTIHLRIANETTGSIPKERAKDQVLYKASQNPWHPGRDFINECRRRYSNLTLEEAKKIVENIASDYLHNDEKVPNVVLGLWLQAHACNTFDIQNAHAPEYVPILCGEQGCFKSSFLHILFGGLTGERSLTTIVSADPQSFFKDVTLISTAWFMEFPEIERWLTKQNLNAFKGRVTDPFPEGRRPYDTLPTKFKRYAVWAGTTNNPEGVLIDKSSNFDRRFIPIQIPAGKFIETELLEENVEKIWAAVMVCVENAPSSRPHTLPQDLYGDLIDYQSPFLEQSPVEGTLLAYASGVNKLNTAQAIRCCFDVAEHEIPPELQAEAKSIYRRHLLRMGFESKKIKENGKGVYYYVRQVQLTSNELYRLQQEANKGRMNKIRFDPIQGLKLEDEDLDF